MLKGTDPVLSKEMLVVGAHYDHLGYFEGDGDTIYNGADDNASGTAALIELARLHSSLETPPKRSIVFAAFSAEELGLLGSRAFIRQIDSEQVALMLNFDMIGRNSDAPIEIIGDGYAVGMKEELLKANEEIGLNLEMAGENYFGASDHDPFFKEDRPFLFFFTGTHEDYHQLSDHIDKLDFEQIHKITSSDQSDPLYQATTTLLISSAFCPGLALPYQHIQNQHLCSMLHRTGSDAELQARHYRGHQSGSSSPKEIARTLKEPRRAGFAYRSSKWKSFEREVTRAKTGYVGSILVLSPQR